MDGKQDIKHWPTQCFWWILLFSSLVEHSHMMLVIPIETLFIFVCWLFISISWSNKHFSNKRSLFCCHREMLSICKAKIKQCKSWMVNHIVIKVLSNAWINQTKFWFSIWYLVLGKQKKNKEKELHAHTNFVTNSKCVFFSSAPFAITGFVAHMFI